MTAVLSQHPISSPIEEEGIYSIWIGKYLSGASYPRPQVGEGRVRGLVWRQSFMIWVGMLPCPLARKKLRMVFDDFLQMGKAVRIKRRTHAVSHDLQWLRGLFLYLLLYLLNRFPVFVLAVNVTLLLLYHVLPSLLLSGQSRRSTSTATSRASRCTATCGTVTPRTSASTPATAAVAGIRT